MPFRGYFALNGVELTNTSRLVAHLGMSTPLADAGMFNEGGYAFIEDPPGSGLYIPAGNENPTGSGLYDTAPYTFTIVESPIGSGLYTTGQCELLRVAPGLYTLPVTSSVAPGHPHLYLPPDGAILYSEGIFGIQSECWDPSPSCPGCSTHVTYDDSWPGLNSFLNDTVYRPELAPWYSTRRPESTEFLGMWVLKVKGLGALPVERSITELVGSGAAAGPNRDTSRTISFEAILIGCSNAGVEYGLDWLACRLRDTATGSDGSLQYFNAHPSHTEADPADFMREVHGVVLKTNVEVQDQYVTRPGPNREANVYRVTWDMVATRPYAYAPPIHVDVDWDEITYQPIEWVHAPDCTLPVSCEALPVLFSATCEPEIVEVQSSPPPSCGGCMPLCTLETYVYHVPTLDYPLRCSETAVSMTIKNTGSGELTLQGYWRSCIADIKCDVQLFPIQVSGLPSSAMLSLDGTEGRYWGIYENYLDTLDPRQARITPGLRGRRLRPVGIVGTPNGSPWTPPIIDREGCWEFVVVAPPGSDFEISMALADREA